MSQYHIDQYRKIHQSKTYGATSDEHDVLTQCRYWAIRARPESALDFGCGQSNLSRNLPCLTHSYDPAIPEFENMPSEEVSMAFCVDVMEHIPKNEISEVLRKIKNATRRYVYFRISLRPSILPPLENGENMHCTVRPAWWWLLALSEHFPLICMVDHKQNDYAAFTNIPMNDFGGIFGYEGRHEGEDAWMFGKGPSFQNFNMDNAGPLRVCINDTWKAVPDATYFFSHDWPCISEQYRNCEAPMSRVIESMYAYKLINMTLGAADNIVSYDKWQCDIPPDANELTEEAKHVLGLDAFWVYANNKLFSTSGTVHSALHFLWYTGVRRVHLVGFDGSENSEYATCFAATGPSHGQRAAEIWRKLKLEADFLGVELIQEAIS